MSWTGRYYYRSRRIAGQPVREYVGGGLLAELEAMRDEEARIERMRQRARDRAQRDKLTALDAPVADLSKLAEALTRLALVEAGFHQHARGQWRRSRGVA